MSFDSVDEVIEGTKPPELKDEVPSQILIKQGELLVDQGCLVRPPQHILEMNEYSKDKTTYQMYHITDEIPSDLFIASMLGLQDQICKVGEVSPDNPVDYKSADEFRQHFQKGGSALAAVVNGQLIGVCLLKEQASDLSSIFQQSVHDEPEIPNSIQVGFLVTDKTFKGNMLAQTLLEEAEKIAEDKGLSAITAGARLWNGAALKRFSQGGFVGIDLGYNIKDGAPVVKMAKEVGKWPVFEILERPSMHEQEALDSADEILPCASPIVIFDRLISDPMSEKEQEAIKTSFENGLVLAWHNMGKRLAIYAAPHYQTPPIISPQPVSDPPACQFPTEGSHGESQPEHTVC